MTDRANNDDTRDRKWPSYVIRLVGNLGYLDGIAHLLTDIAYQWTVCRQCLSIEVKIFDQLVWYMILNWNISFIYRLYLCKYIRCKLTIRYIYQASFSLKMLNTSSSKLMVKSTQFFLHSFPLKERKKEGREKEEAILCNYLSIRARSLTECPN